MNTSDMSRIKPDNRTQVLRCIAVLSLIMLRLALTARLPIHVRSGYRTDDGLLMEMTVNLLNGTWLGPYSAVKLMKGCFFALFLAFLNRLGIPYLSGLTILYSLSCLFFTYQLKPLLRTYFSRLILFIVLLFNPVSYSLLTFQRVYRNSITATQVLFITGAYIGFYLKIRGKNETLNPICSILITVLTGLTVWGFINTREDSAFIYPFIAVASLFILIFGAILPSARKDRHMRLSAILSVVFVLSPLLITFLGNRWILRNNQSYYGIPVRLEIAQGSYPQAIDAIYGIKNQTNIQYVSVSREKLSRLYAASPTLLSIKNELDEQVDYYASIDRKPEDGEAEDGWFFWALRRGAFNAGAADTAPKAEDFYRQVKSEISTAVRSGQYDLETQATMPSALVSPWRHEYGRELPLTMLRALKYMVTFKEVETTAEESFPGSPEAIHVFEAVTGNQTIYPQSSDAVNTGDPGQYAPYIKVLSLFNRLYQLLNPSLFLISILLLFLIIQKQQQQNNARFLLILASLILTLTAMIGGVAYTDISAFAAVRYFYLTGGYPLLLATEWISILYYMESATSLHFLNLRRIFHSKPDHQE